MNRNIHYINIIAQLLLLGAATPAFGQTIKGNVYGGGNLSQVVGSTTINVKSGSINSETADDGNIYGGGYGASAVLTGNTTINVSGGTIAKDVYGGGALANVTGSTEVNIQGGTVAQDVYGGGALANVTGSTEVNLTGGTISDSYGGGLGSNEVAALIGGDATTTLNGSIVLGNVFGCNNLNGTPQGHAFVDVKKTTAKGTETAEHPYHVAGVYGGGNLAAYVPTSDTEKAEVLIENCDNSIEDVFGGGNAAAVPETDVTVWGGLLGRVFAGGNGESAPANVTRDTHVMIHGGTIREVYGGSNNSGDIGGTIHVDVAELKYFENDLCPINVDDLYGGGNLAASNAGQINIGKCTSIDRVFGGAHNADVNGDITLAINDGHINSVFGGNNEGGDINGAITVNIEWVNDAEASLNNVYGGGNLAPYTTPDGKEGPTVNLTNGEVSENVYGGGLGKEAVVKGNPIVNLIGATVTNDIFGGGDAAPVIGNPLVNAEFGTTTNIFAGGRGETAVVTGDPLATINQTNDKTLTISEAVYGGGDAANVVGTAGVQMLAGTVSDIYGGGNAADVTNTEVVIEGGTITRVFGGGHGNKGNEDPEHPIAPIAANVTNNANTSILGGQITQVFAAGNQLGAVEGQATLTIEKKKLGGDATPEQIAALPKLNVTEAYGGGNQANGNAGTVIVGCTGGADEGVKDVFGGAREADVTSDITLNIKGGNIERVFGGNNVSGNVEGAIIVNIDEEPESCGLSLNYVYGGGQDAGYSPTTPGAYPEVNIKNGTVQHDVFGGGLGVTAVVKSNPVVNVSGGQVSGDVYGGGALADVDGNTSVVISGGHSGNVYGGGLGQLEDAETGKEAVAAKVVNTSVRVEGDGIAENVFGCNNTLGSPTGMVIVEIAGGTVNNNVYGGGHLATAGTEGDAEHAAVRVNPEVTVSGGTVTHDVYGGGALADLYGNTTVNLTGGSVGGAYGGALGAIAGKNGATEDVVAKVYGDTYVHLDGSQVTETGIFGANNLNGTPTGHAFVHVTKTTAKGTDGERYHVPAVYGGGNLSAYEPSSNTDFAEVLIENCDNSIEYVYGGGNAAPVPATKVVIKGANSIKHAFAGGNGAGQSTDPSAANYNPGADVGYLGYRSSGNSTEYGSGLASITVNGGTVDNVYGGSNTLGFIRGGTSVSVANEDGACTLNVGNVFGGGNEADIDCSVTINLDCNEGADILYAGANNANVNGDITLNISSGTFGQVFCGNNEGGNVKGNLVVNVDETGCQPVMIGELYACGNKAPYSVYGYDNDGNCITTRTAMTMPQPYNDPVINLISFTRIGAVFGGGFGATADLYGDTHVNVDVIPGLFAGKDSAEPTYVLDANDNRVLNEASRTDLPVGVSRVEGTKKLKIHNDIGTIGNIYGGGNEATVHGNTHILIGTEAVDLPGMHVTGTDAVKAMDAQPVAATITGDVFGGGKTAIVTGNTHVTIGE